MKSLLAFIFSVIVLQGLLLKYKSGERKKLLVAPPSNIIYFTYGYDTYTPDEVLVTHDYHNHQGNPGEFFFYLNLS